MGIEVENLHLAGAFILKPMNFEDHRGIFRKLFTAPVLSAQGVKPVFEEEYLLSSKKNVLRGLHYQKGDLAQAKLITCLCGEIYDMMVDMRQGSATYLKWAGVGLSEKNRHCLYVPRGFAHGFLTLSDESLVIYKVDSPYAPDQEDGVRWDDPAVGMKWPAQSPILSEKDGNWPLLGAKTAP